MRTIAIISLFFLLPLCPVSSAHGEQYVQGDKVVHTRLAPVVVHRIFPPFHGRHVYQGRVARR